MAATITPQPRERLADVSIARSFLQEDSRRLIRSTPWERPAETNLGTFGAAALAGAVRENALFSAWHELTDGDDTRSLEAVRNYNPYRVLKEKYDAETLAALAPNISDGDFDLVRSDRQLDAVVKDILYERKLQTDMEKDGLGYFVGSLLTSVVDPTSYIPFVGMGAKVGRLGKIGIVALNASLSAGVSEAALQMTQRERSLDETLMNIGTSALIGGGIGYFAPALHPRSKLNPKNPDNVFRPETLRQQGEVVRDMYGRRDEFTADEIEELRRFASVGAAAIGSSGPRLARSEPKTLIGKAARAIGDAVLSVTPKGQILRATSDEARWVGVRLFDPAGILTVENLKGVGNARSATILKQDYMSEYEQMMGDIAGQTRRLSVELGNVKIRQEDMLTAVQRHLYGMMDQNDVAVLRSKWGDNFDRINAEAVKFADRIHEHNAVWEKRLVDTGLMQDTGKVAQLEAELKALREEVKTLAAIGEFDGSSTTNPVASVDAKAIEAARLLRDQKARELYLEKQKPAPLGREYGHAQLWDKTRLFQNPAEVKAWLHDVLAHTPDEGWLIETKHMTLKEFEELDPEAANAIRQEWAGDEYLWRVEGLELALEKEQAAFKEAKLDLMETMRALGVARRDETDITLSEARKRRDALNAQVAANKANQKALRKVIRSITLAADAGRSTTADRLARQEKGIASQPEITRSNRVARGVRLEQKLEQTIEDVLTDPATPLDPSGKPRFQDAGDVAQQTDGVVDNNLRILKAEENVRRDVDTVSVDTARVQGRAAEAQIGLNTAIREGEELAAKATRLNDELRQLEAVHEAVTSARQNLTQAVRDARAARNIAETDLRAVKRKLRGARDKTPLNELIEQVYDNLTDGTVPHGIIDRILDRSDRETGRVKTRSLNLTREQRAEAIRKGWLRSDLSNILLMQNDQLASEFALNEALEIGKGRRFESWDSVLQWVERSYQDRMVEVGDQSVKTKLEAEMQRTVDNLIAVRNRIKGGHHIDDGTAIGALRWGSAKLRQANLIRYGSGFLLSSQTDLATVALRHGNVARLLKQYGKRAIREMRSAFEENPTQFQSMIRAVEISAGAHAAAKRYGSADVIEGNRYGYGIGYGKTRKITGAIDRGGEFMAELGIRIGGLPIWNAFMKTLSGLSMLDKLNTMTRSYDKLTPAQVADLATLGIGAPEARRMAMLMERYGETDAEGHFDPHFERWHEAGDAGREAARDARLAIMRDMDRSINTPDAGDTPRLMDTMLGQFLLTFQTFAFTFMNQFAYPMVQRLSLFQEKQAMGALAMLVLTATSVVVGKDLINGRDPSERFTSEKWGETVYEIVDRSGILGWTSPYIDSALKLTSGYTGFAGGSRYARNGWGESILGVNAGLLSDIQRATASAVDPSASFEDRVRKLLAIHPYAAQAKLFGRILNINDE